VKGGALSLVLLAATAAPLGWVVSDQLESRNEFCITCHLDTDTPLHIEKFESFRAEAPTSLVAAHWAARSSSDGEFRCSDCHAGASLANRMRVKAISVRDTLKWAVGDFGEPDHMTYPLLDEDCVQCHETYAPRRRDAFHALNSHNVALPYSCVECHRSHTDGSPADLFFLDREVVLPLCRNCHKEF
jgi:nitrate/TMAO reductase-like tetraheme cytochrome c subunit